MQVRHIGVHESVDDVFPPERLVDALADVEPSIAVVGDDVADCDAVVTFEHREAFLSEPSWVHSIQAGVDRFPLESYDDAGVALTNSSGIHGESVGEMVLGYMVSLARALPRYARDQAERTWAKPAWDRPFSLAGEELCVVGLGTLGRGIATRADALGMTVTGVKRTVEPVPGVETVHSEDELQAAIADARFVALAVPLNEGTRGLVAEPEFAAMREDAFLVNVARGPVVDEEVLVAALRADEIAGAALDVFEQEPLPADSPLWDREDVLVTPHVAATVRSYYADIADLVVENVERQAAGEPFTNRVV